MAGLLMLGVFVAWAYFSVKIAAVIASAADSRLAKASSAIAVFAVVLVAPIADDLLGNWRYQRYCQAGDKVDYRATISVTPDVGLFTADGNWRIAGLGPSDHAERRRLSELAESFVRWDHGTSVPTDSIFPIQEHGSRIFDKSTGQLLAEWKSYHYRGGFLRRGLLDSSSQCFPSEFGRDLYRRMFVLERK